MFFAHHPMAVIVGCHNQRQALPCAAKAGRFGGGHYFFHSETVSDLRITRILKKSMRFCPVLDGRTYPIPTVRLQPRLVGAPHKIAEAA